MCFSASASFGAGAVLSAIGVVTIRNTKNTSHLAFAGMPILFAVQQVSEGFVWLTLQHPEYGRWQSVPINVFMVFAHVVWPTWIVLAVFLLEKEIVRKKALYVLLALAFLLSGSEIYYMIVYPASAQINHHHVDYLFDYPKPYVMAAEISYGLTTILPCFISSVRRMWLLGIAFIISLIFSAIFFRVYLLSVWCFFAALMSVLMYIIIQKNQWRAKAIAKF